jgi:hypothetical protein
MSWSTEERRALDDVASRCDALLAEYKARAASAWYNQPRPRRWHRCRVVHGGVLDDGVLVERCACGGIRLNGGRWMERNS